MVRSERRLDGGHLRLVVDAGKGNLFSIAVMRALRRALGEAALAGTKLVTIEGAGDHFSYGASVEEHRADGIESALAELRGLILDLLEVPAPTAAIVRGRCLGGGFEVALACDVIFAASTALLGVPEIALGVFPPAAAALLPVRVGASRAARAVLTGQAMPVDRWEAAGLVELAMPAETLDATVDKWFEAFLAPRSAAALGYAARASREGTRQHLARVLPALERLYLDQLMRTHDAHEGVEAFIARRAPVWTHA